MQAVTKFTFYDRFNEALVNQDCHLTTELISHALKDFKWSEENKLKLSSLLQELG